MKKDIILLEDNYYEAEDFQIDAEFYLKEVQEEYSLQIANSLYQLDYLLFDEQTKQIKNDIDRILIILDLNLNPDGLNVPLNNVRFTGWHWLKQRFPSDRMGFFANRIKIIFRSAFIDSFLSTFGEDLDYLKYKSFGNLTLVSKTEDSKIYDLLLKFIEG